jgi:signal transduction histidine kinase/integral membrane sensor domain MASE1
MLLVFGGYALGSYLGFCLRIPPATTSLMWPPNALLTASLLLTRPGRGWAQVLAAALPAHLLVQLSMGLTLPTSLCFFATNCSEALLAAGLIQRLGDAPDRFDTLRRATIFILAAVLTAPFVSCFLDAGVMVLFRGEPYWQVWRTRFYSNMLTELALVPALVSVGRAVREGTRVPRWRSAEILLLGAALVAVGTLVFAGPSTGPSVLPWSSHTALMLLLPVLLWAATRFGSGGSSWALLTTALLAIAATAHGNGTLKALPPAEGVLVLQVFLLLVGVPLFCLAALVEEQRSTARALEERLRFEGLLLQLSWTFVHMPSNIMDSAFADALRRVGEFFGMDHALLLRVAAGGQRLEVAWSWSGPHRAEGSGVASRPAIEPTVEGLRCGSLLVIPEGDEDSNPDLSRDHFAAGGGWSLTLPLEAGRKLLGGLTLAGLRTGAPAGAESNRRLRLVAEVFAGALARKETEDAVRASEAMKSAILASLTSAVAVLDRSGRIIAVNENWARLLRGVDPEVGGGVGVDFVEAWRGGAAARIPEGEDAAAGIEAVLDVSRAAFAFEYRCAPEGSERWLALSVVPLRRPEGGAVVSYTDVTERRQAEVETQRIREELAHCLRVSTVGELITSVAHELNQPLTAILANAQAARRLLQEQENEIEEILADIVEEDKRAGAMIRRLRDLLRKRDPERAPVDINGLVREVAQILSGDTLIRRVQLQLDLARDLPWVTVDRIQIQQVLLNLLLNSMEAMAEIRPGERLMVVRTALQDEAVQVTVEDTGIGLGDGQPLPIFEPFYTTKPAGMGMGLSIARSIVEAHGGRIWARNRARRGAVFCFSLPGLWEDVA